MRVTEFISLQWWSKASPSDKDLRSVGIGLAALALVGLGLVGWTWPNSMGIALLWSIAYYASGFLVGFLFGFPRVLDSDREHRTGQANASPSTGPYARLAINTNLEQVSDWLTKIIVGLGLVNLKSFPNYVGGLARYTAAALTPANEPAAAALVLYFAVLGLLGGYLVTRMFFGAAFRRADENTLSIQEQHSLSAAPSSSIDKEGAPKLEGLAAQAAEKLQGVTPEEAKSRGIMPAVLARAKLDARDFEGAVAAYSEAIRMSPYDRDPKLRLDYALALREAGRSNQEVIAALRDALVLSSSASADLRRSIYESLIFVSLYVEPPDGFRQAIFYGEEYTRSPANLPSARLWARLACAYGQQASWDAGHPGEKDTFSKAEAFSETLKLARDAARTAIGLNPAWRKRLRDLMEPTPEDDQEGENDLKVFKEDNDFRELLGLP